LKNNYNTIFIIDGKSQFDAIALNYNIENDLVLTYDFALKKHISDFGGNVEYIDHLVSSEELQKNNYLIYEFFRNWHYDEDGNDIFTFKDIPFGFSFRLDFWNDFVSYTRLYLSLKSILNNTFLNLYVKTNDTLILKILNELKISFKIISNENIPNEAEYYFPISKWIDSKIKPTGLRSFLYKTREKISYYYGVIMPLVDKVFKSEAQYTIFIQDYHPTKKIIQDLRNDKKLTILLENFSRYSNKLENLKERLLPINGDIEDYAQVEFALLEKFKHRRYHRLILSDKSDISDAVYDIILRQISGRIVYKLRTLNSCIKYLNKNKVDLVVLIANMGHTATLFDLVCQYKKIPSFLIINGILAKNYQDEGKYATYINSYSKSIKENYFKNMNNIMLLGDPRMDMYSQMEQKVINRDIPTITIGTSGFNPTDLNSYVAVEFDFIYDILKAFSLLKEKGEIFKLIIKVRPNGYREQYKSFINTYFQDLKIEIVSTTPMIEVLKVTDFYITIYSQTLFEASCLGIPVVYYKKDTEITNSPFDNNSELVTVSTIDGIKQAFLDFKEKHSRYNDFLDKKVMEKYIGFLDGNNLNRNLDFIYKILNRGNLK
jgi:hypothetical protein